MHADVGGFRRCIGKGYRTVEGNARLPAAAKLHQQPALDAEEVKIAGKPVFQRLDQQQRRFGTVHLGHRYGAIQRDNG